MSGAPNLRARLVDHGFHCGGTAGPVGNQGRRSRLSSISLVQNDRRPNDCQEAAMTDYRDPNYRDPYRDPITPNMNRPGMDAGAWSNATWGWIAGICVVVLILIFTFGSGNDRTQTAND